MNHNANANASTIANTIAPASPLLETRGLVKRFGGLLATDDVSLTLLPGEIHALIGPNGAGKSTLIGQLCGEIKPDQGQVLIQGNDVTGLSVNERANLGLARSYQITQVCKDFSAMENVMIAAMARQYQDEASVAGIHFKLWRPFMRQASVKTAAEQALLAVGLQDRLSTPAAVMAHGEHRQLELAMALALKPKFLLLDEPLAGMSGAESDQMVELLLGLKSQYPMLLIEHDMNAVFNLANRISVLVYGKVIATGNADQIRNDPLVKTAYLGEEDHA
jgi:branched-chain amino acid transport system ATP-binding protein